MGDGGEDEAGGCRGECGASSGARAMNESTRDQRRQPFARYTTH